MLICFCLEERAARGPFGAIHTHQCSIHTRFSAIWSRDQCERSQGCRRPPRGAGIHKEEGCVSVCPHSPTGFSFSLRPNFPSSPLIVASHSIDDHPLVDFVLLYITNPLHPSFSHFDDHSLCELKHGDRRVPFAAYNSVTTLHQSPLHVLTSSSHLGNVAQGRSLSVFHLHWMSACCQGEPSPQMTHATGQLGG